MNTTATKNLQNDVLDKIIKTRKPVTVYLCNGFQMKGTLTAYDSYVIMISQNGINSVVFKHAVSTITPSEDISL